MFPYDIPQGLLDKSFSMPHELCPTNQDPPIFYPFSPLSFFDGTIHDLLHPSHLVPTPNMPPSNPPPTKQAVNNIPPTKNSPIRKRALRKDRHSKICTAQGPRDRRMRLSLDVARRFFCLQDMLGYDKASKTVQWLLTMSDKPIKDLICASRSKEHLLLSDSSTSECENISTVSDNKGKSPLAAVNKPDDHRPRKPKRSTTVRSTRIATLHPKLAKQSRDDARARARERTTEKKKSQGGWTDHDTAQLPKRLCSSSIPLENIEDESKKCSPSQDHNCSTERPYDFPLGLNPSFHCSKNFIDNQDVINSLQGQRGLNFAANMDEASMENRDLLADVVFHVSRSNWEVFNNNHIP